MLPETAPLNDTPEALHQDRIRRVKQLLKEMSHGAISPSAYDTAWVARIPAANGREPMFPGCLDWVRTHQLRDGSWGTAAVEYIHDRIICTLSCIIALKTWETDPEQVQRGEAYIRQNLHRLDGDEAATVGFELILPTLLQQAQALGLDLPYEAPVLHKITADRARKLQRIPLEVIYTRPTTALHSLEGFGELLDCQRILSQQSPNGSFLNSPSATAFVYMKTGDDGCLRYIQEMLDHFGDAVPVNYPIDIFERLWVLNTLHKLGLAPYFEPEIADHLAYIKQHWTDHGIGWSRHVRIPDVDDTAVAFHLLRWYGEPVSADVFHHFYDGERFFCYPGELNGTASHTLNLYEAARLNYGEDILQKAETFATDLLQRYARSDVRDKWLVRENLSEQITHTLQQSPFFWAPVVERRHQLALFSDNDYWIDKTIYELPNVNSPLFLELAQLEDEVSRRAFRAELHELSEWAAQHLDAVHQVRVASTHFIACNLLPQGKHRAARLMLSKVTLWIFGIDEFFDGDALDLPDLETMCEVFLTNTTALLAQFQDPQVRATIDRLRHALYACIEEASTAQGWDVTAAFLPLLRTGLESCLYERAVRAEQHRPDFKSYLNYARHTIGVSLVLTMTYYMMARTTRAVMTGPACERINTLASDIIRVLNDVRSYEKELGEGKRNSVGIVMQDKGCSADQAAAWLLNRYYRRQIKKLLRLTLEPSSVPRAYKMLAFDMCRTTAWFYQANDFHTYARTIRAFFGLEDMSTAAASGSADEVAAN